MNPFARELTFGDLSTRARRDHRKLLTLIRAVALLHQHQRPTKTVEQGGARLEYIEVTKADIELAEKLMATVVPGELPAHSKYVLRLLEVMATEHADKSGVSVRDYRFTRRQARERLGIGGTQLWVHLKRLVEAEYLIVHPSRRGRGVIYELPVHGEAERSAYVRGGGRTNSPKEDALIGPHSASAAYEDKDPARKSRRTSSASNGAG